MRGRLQQRPPKDVRFSKRLHRNCSFFHFYTELAPVLLRPTRQKVELIYSMKTKTSMTILTMAGVAVLATGCVEEHREYVPVYRDQPAYVTQAPYGYQTQTAYQPAPGTAPTPAPDAAAAPSAAPTPEAPPPPAVVAPTAPPPPQVEVVTVAPGPAYVWAPGYWSWNGSWVWIRGSWVIRPHYGAIWVGPHWIRHGHGYVWVRGHWR